MISMISVHSFGLSFQPKQNDFNSVPLTITDCHINLLGNPLTFMKAQVTTITATTIFPISIHLLVEL